MSNSNDANMTNRKREPAAQTGHLSTGKPFLLREADDPTNKVADKLRRVMNGKATSRKGKLKNVAVVAQAAPLNWKAPAKK